MRDLRRPSVIAGYCCFTSPATCGNTCRANSKFTNIYHFYTNTCNFAGCQTYATYTRKNHATTSTEIFAAIVTVTTSSILSGSSAFTHRNRQILTWDKHAATEVCGKTGHVHYCVEWAIKMTSGSSGPDCGHPVRGPESDAITSHDAWRPISGQSESSPIRKSRSE